MNFRIGDGVGPDYKCSKCGLVGHRLWRESHIFLTDIELMCASCAEVSEAENIRRYAKFHQAWESSIGNMIPARPTPDGETFWGHTSGDTLWWYFLPQYPDEAKETARYKIEREFFIRRMIASQTDWFETWTKAGDERAAWQKATGCKTPAEAERLKS